MNDCKDLPVKDELESLQDTFYGYYKRIEAYMDSGQEFQCNTFLRQVRRIFNLFVQNDGLAYYCEFRWYVRYGGWFRKNTIERMMPFDDTSNGQIRNGMRCNDEPANLCEEVGREGFCNFSCRRMYAGKTTDLPHPYCRVQLPCQPHCEKCNESIVRASRFLNYASNDLAACHLQLQNVNGRN